MLTAFNGNTITYDTIGNPLQYYNGNVFTWEQGRKLSTITQNGSFFASFDYDDNGIRTSKTTQWSSYKYILNGSQIVAETWDDCINIYLYDEYGSPIGFLHRYANMAENTYKTFFYEKNMFGDILAIYDENGVKQVSYSYDAFGKSTETIHVSGTRATQNNLRYRGYYYDKETGFYYLNSRYYDPVTCRFINADGYASTGQGLIGNNMFAYCNNNPVMYVDLSGEFSIAIPVIEKIVTIFVVAILTLVVLDTVIDSPTEISLPDISLPKRKAKTKTEEKVEEKTETTVVPKDPDGPAIFPEDPNTFNPVGLVKVYRPGTINGRLVSWMDPRTNVEVFRWDENTDHLNGPHYHIYGTGHYYPGMIVPEPYATLYFPFR